MATRLYLRHHGHPGIPYVSALWFSPSWRLRLVMITVREQADKLYNGLEVG